MKLICNVLFQMVYGIGLEFASLPGEWWLHALLLVIMMITLAYLEVGEGGKRSCCFACWSSSLTHTRVQQGLQVALIDAKKYAQTFERIA